MQAEPAYSHGVVALAFPDSVGVPPLLASCGRDGTVSVWLATARTRCRLAVLHGHLVGGWVGGCRKHEFEGMST